jgi:hypothetical protein
MDGLGELGRIRYGEQEASRGGFAKGSSSWVACRRTLCLHSQRNLYLVVQGLHGIPLDILRLRAHLQTLPLSVSCRVVDGIQASVHFAFARVAASPATLPFFAAFSLGTYMDALRLLMMYPEPVPLLEAGGAGEVLTSLLSSALVSRISRPSVNTMLDMFGCQIMRVLLGWFSGD